MGIATNRSTSRRRDSLAAATGLAALLAGCPAGDPGPPLSARAQRGREVFLLESQPRCGGCHIVRHAGSQGAVGPDLDQTKPSFERVVQVVTEGIGVMEPQKDELSKDDIEALATYLSEVTQR